MQSLATLDSFVRSARTGSFSAAARQLALTPAAVSRNVATLERQLGVRLFHRSTRKLALTESGEHLLGAIEENLDGLQGAIASIATDRGQPAGVLKVSMGLGVGLNHILPLLPQFLERYPLVRPDWHFESRQVDLIAEGFDAAIGGGFDLPPGIIARPLAPLHVIAVASPQYMKGRTPPTDPANLARLDGIVLRQSRTGRVAPRVMRNAAGVEVQAAPHERIVLGEPVAMGNAAVMGLGVTFLAMPDALPHLESGALIRLVPQWYADLGTISLYYATRTLMPAKTRAFVDFVTEAFKRERYAERFAGSLG